MRPPLLTPKLWRFPFILLFVLAVLPNESFAQSSKVERLIDEERFGEAIKYLKKDFDTEGNVEAGLLLAKCYYKMQDYSEALDALIQVDISRIKNPDDIRFYSDVLIAADDYSLAYLMLIQQFAEDQTDAKTFLWLSKTSDLLRWDTIDSGSRSFNVSGINTPYSEHSPYFTLSGELWFVSDLNSVQSIFPASFSDQNIQLLHKTSRKPGAEYQVELPSMLQKSRNHFDHDGQIEKWPNHDEYALTIKELDGNPVNAISGIYFSSLVGNRYKMTPFEYNSACNAMHPTFNEDGSRIYFSSDREGGYGQTDIWYSDWIDEKWSEPVNLGPGVNTPSNEVYPRYHGRRVFFSSDRRDVGYGGLDMYFTSELLGFKGSANMRAPINSPFDDFSAGFIDQEVGYIASNREGGAGGNDIYEFIFKPEQIYEKELIAQIIRDIVPQGTQYRLIAENGEVLHDGVVAKDGTITLGNVEADKNYTLHVLHDGIAAEALLSIGTRGSHVKQNIAHDGLGKFKFGMMGYDEFYLGKQEYANPVMSKFDLSARIIAAEETDFSGVQIVLKDEFGVVQDIIEPDIIGRFNFKSLDVGDVYRMEVMGLNSEHSIDVYGKSESVVQSIGPKERGDFSYIKSLPKANWMIDAAVPVNSVLANLDEANVLPGESLDLFDHKGILIKSCSVDASGNINLGRLVTGKVYNLTKKDGTVLDNSRLKILSASGEVSQVIRSKNSDTFQFEYILPRELTTNKIRVLDIAPEMLPIDEILSNNTHRARIIDYSVPADAILYRTDSGGNLTDSLSMSEFNEYGFSKPVFDDEYSMSFATQLVAPGTKMQIFNKDSVIVGEAITSDGKTFVFGTKKSVTKIMDVEEKVSDLAKNDLSRSFDISDVYFDFDSDIIKENSKKALEGLVEMLMDLPDKKVEIGAHTDSRGPKDYNLKLSQRRADSVMKYLLEKGISEDRMFAVGYGELRPINQCIDGMSCAEADHAQNRRTSIVLAGVIPESEDNSELSNNGFTAKTAEKETSIILEKGKILEVPEIYFNLNSHDLSDESKDSLKELLKFLVDFPELRIEIGAHTDARASAAYNKSLSERRAQSVFQYLIGQGINAERLSTTGYGEMRLSNRCSDGVQCSEVEHSLNRRTVFTVL